MKNRRYVVVFLAIAALSVAAFADFRSRSVNGSAEVVAAEYTARDGSEMRAGKHYEVRFDVQEDGERALLVMRCELVKFKRFATPAPAPPPKEYLAEAIE